MEGSHSSLSHRRAQAHSHLPAIGPKELGDSSNIPRHLLHPFERPGHERAAVTTQANEIAIAAQPANRRTTGRTFKLPERDL